MRSLLGCKPFCNLIPIDQVEEVAYEVWSLVPVVNLRAAQASGQGTLFHFQGNAKGDQEEGESSHSRRALHKNANQCQFNSSRRRIRCSVQNQQRQQLPSHPQTSMVSRGVWPLGTGFSALGVLVTASLSSSLTSQAHPEPADKRGPCGK